MTPRTVEFLTQLGNRSLNVDKQYLLKGTISYNGTLVRNRGQSFQI